MKTTVELPDALLRRAKSVAAAKGQTLRRFLTEAMTEKLNERGGNRRADSGWRAVFGKGPVAEIRKVDAIIAREFSRVDPKDWA